MKKKLLISLAVLLLMALLIPLLYIGICKLAYPGTADNDKVSYLQSHAIELDPEHITIPYDFIALPKYKSPRCFILGEIHGFSPIRLFDAQLMMHLNKTEGIRVYGAEIFSENAERLNNFLNSAKADKQLLTAIISDIAHDTPQNNTHEYYDEWMLLHQYYQRSDENHRIKVIGLLGPKSQYKESRRDQIMADNFMACLKNDSTKTYTKNGVYCSVGIAHALQAPYQIKDFKVSTFAYLLKQQQVSVTSMVLMPLESACFFPKNDEMVSPPDESTTWVSADGPINYFTNIVNLKKASKGMDMAIYKLNAENSPYAHGNDFVGSKSALPFIAQPYQAVSGYNTTDYFQYILMIRGLDAPKRLLPYRN